MNNFLVKTSGQNPAEDSSVKTLVLLHGWGMNSQVWEPIREVIEKLYHVIWVDLPGHGFNRHVEAQSFEQMVDLIAEVIPKQAHLIGWSLGGLVAQSLTEKLSQQNSKLNTRKIRSMTLVTSTPRFSQSVQGENEDWQHAMSDEVLSRFAENLKQDTEKTIKGFIALQFIGVKNSKQAQNNLINHILYNGKDNKKMASKWGGVISDNISEGETAPISEKLNIPTLEALDLGLDILKHADLRKLTPSCPEHWIFAEYDRLIPKEVINDLISLRPDAEITLLEKAGHAPFITHTESFLARTIHFIENLD